MEVLKTYLRETRMTAAAFAKVIGVELSTVERLLAGQEVADLSLAQRMIDATGGALLLEDFIPEGPEGGRILDLRSRLSSQSCEIDADLLTRVLATVLPDLIGGSRRAGDEHLPRLAADAAAHTYLALSTITSRRGPHRLSQALQPVFSEILEDLSAPAAAHERLHHAIERATALYFQARSEKRRA